MKVEKRGHILIDFPGKPSASSKKKGTRVQWKWDVGKVG